MGQDDTVNAGALTVEAYTRLPGSGYDVQADATGSAGALIGITSTNAEVTDNAHVSAFIDVGANFVIAGALTVTALNSTKQKTSSDSNAGGLIAAGIASSKTSSSTVTDAHVGSGGSNSASDNISVHAATMSVTAVSGDDNFAYTNAGSGGLIAGASATADTGNASSTTASVGRGTVTLTSKYDVHAEHTATWNPQITTFAGGLLAGAGATETSNVTSNVTANTGANTTVNAYGISITANNNAEKPVIPGSTPENIKGTTGGLISGASASTTNNISFTTLVTVGANTHLNSLGIVTNNADLQLRTDNSFNVHDDASFETGGALSGAGVNGTINVSTESPTSRSARARCSTARGRSTSPRAARVRWRKTCKPIPSALAR